jgi:hypothetical protein
MLQKHEAEVVDANTTHRKRCKRGINTLKSSVRLLFDVLGKILNNTQLNAATGSDQSKGNLRKDHHILKNSSKSTFTWPGSASSSLSYSQILLSSPSTQISKG